MNYGRYGFRALCFSFLAVLVLGAIAAGPAQAEGEWKIGGKTLAELGLKEESVAGSAGETFTITESSAAKLEITCKTLTTEKANILSGGSSSETFVLEACALQGEIAKHCKLLNPVKSAALKAHLFLHNGKTYDLLEPAEGTTFMTMKFERIGAEGFCLIGEELAFKGTVVAEMEAGERSEQPLIFKSSELEKLFPTDSLKLGANTAAIKGKAVLHLIGEHKNQMWTGIG